jgi:hypothetical protein
MPTKLAEDRGLVLQSSLMIRADQALIPAFQNIIDRFDHLFFVPL